MNGHEVTISDLSKCEPASALAKRLQPGCWRVVDYETIDGLCGKMLFSVGRHHAPALNLPLNVSGSYRIFLGINYSRVAAHSGHGELWIKLSGDRGFVPVALESPNSEGEDIPDRIGKKREIFVTIHETYWRTADLSDQSFQFRPPVEPYRHADGLSNIAYLRLEPVERTQSVDSRSAGRGETSTGNLALLWCSAELTGSTKGRYLFHPADRRWYHDSFAPYVESDVGLFVVEALRGNLCLFDTSTGDVGTEDGKWPENRPETLRTFVQIGHEYGRKVFVGMRMIGAWYPIERFPIHTAGFYWENQRFAKRDREGRPGSGLSLAFPEVRNHWLQLLREALQRGADGVTLYLNRCAPFVFYETPAIESFRAKFSDDPRNLPVNDERWVRHCGTYVTKFLKEIRCLLDEKAGRQLAVVFNTAEFGSRKNGRVAHKYHFDVDTWISEGLVDYLMPTKKIEDRWIRRWRELGGERLHIWPDLRPRGMPGEYYVRRARRFYEAGADGFCFWDGERRPPRTSEWATARFLGHRDALDQMEKDAQSHFTRRELKILNGLSVDLAFHDG